jgi:hypothetical protein
VEDKYYTGNYALKIKQLLNKLKYDQIIFSKHCRERAKRRQIKLADIASNLENPKNLFLAQKRVISRQNEESYKCYFYMSGQQTHIYGIVFNYTKRFIKIATVIKSRPKLQRRLSYEKN